MKPELLPHSPQDYVAQPDDDFGVVKEPTIGEFLLAALRSAKRGLRRNSIDEFEDLLEYCFAVRRELWPPEVARFLDRRILPPAKRRKKVGRRAEWFKLPAHRMRSKEADLNRFYADPNRVAAHWAAMSIDEMRGVDRRSRSKGPYKVSPEDGPRMNVTDVAVRRAVEQVNSLRVRSTKRVNFDIVKELVRKGRTRRPR